MDEEKTIAEKEQKLLKETIAYRGRNVSTRVLIQMLHTHQLKYIDDVLARSKERELALGNLKELQHDFITSKQWDAVRIAEESKGDERYFETHKIDKELYKPISLWKSVLTKEDEIQQLDWKIEYWEQIIRQLKSLLRRKSIWGFIRSFLH